MSKLLDQMREEARALQLNERELLAEELVDGLRDLSPKIMDAWAAESEKRMKSYKAGEDRGVTYWELRAQIELLS